MWRILIIFIIMGSSAWGAKESPRFQVQEFPQLQQMDLWDPALWQMHVKLYQGYVKHAEALCSQIQELSRKGKAKTEEYGALKRRLAWEIDGIRLHELYFSQLGAPSSIAMDPSLIGMIEEEFGSVQQWKQDFIATGLMRGIGWVVLAFDPVHKQLYNLWIQEHDTGHLVSYCPLLIMDVFEHAYITQFGLDRERYIDLFFRSLQWDVVNQRWKKYSP